MGFLARAVAQPQRQAAAFSEDFWPELLGSLRSKAGVTVTAEQALKVATVFACLRVIMEGVAQVPLKVFLKRAGGGRDSADDHPLHWLLYRRPNEWQTSFEFRETVVLHAALCGRFIGFKNIVRGQLREILPIEPSSARVDVDNLGRLHYFVKLTPGGSEQEVPASLIWHVKGPSWSGYDGLQILSLAREAIGLAIATEESHALMHANGVQTQGVYSVDAKLDETAYKALQRHIERQAAGASRHKPLILDRAGKWLPTAMTGVDSQHIDTRRHQIYEICGILRVLPIMIGVADKTATYASAEQMFIAHVVHTLSPWYERLQQSIDVHLIGEDDFRKGYYAKFMPNGLMRGAAKDRAGFYWQMWQMGTLNPNEIREYEDMNPYEGGDRYRVPANTVDANDDAQDETKGSSPGGGNPASGRRVNVGRVLSGKNERRIRDADGLLNDVLAELDDEPQE